MAARRRDPRGLQPRKPGTYYHHALLLTGRRRLPACLLRAPQHGVLETADGLAGVNLAPAVVAVSAGADLSGAAVPHLAGPICVRDQQPAEADQVAGALGEGSLCRLRRFDPAQADHRETAGSRAEPRVERQEGPWRVMHVGQMGVEGRPERALAEGEIVEHAFGRGGGGGDALRLVGGRSRPAPARPPAA